MITTARQWKLAVLIITIAGAILRCVGIERQSFWYDEAVSAQLANAPVADLAGGVVKDNGNPPLYWMLEHIWSANFGHSEAQLRSLAVLFGVLAVPALAVLGRALLGYWPGILAAGMLAISPLAIELSDEARPYALLQFMAIVSTLSFARWVQRKQRLDAVVYPVTVFLTCYTHYFGFFVPIVHGLSLLADRERRGLIGRWTASMGVAGLLWAPWAPIFWTQLHAPGNLSRMGNRWTLQFLVTPMVFGLGRTFAWRDSSLVILGAATGAACAAFWGPAAWKAIRPGQRDGENPAGTLPLLVLWLLLPIVVPLAVAILFKPVYHHRYATVGLPAFMLLIGGGLAKMPRRVFAGFAAVIVALTCVSIANYLREPIKDDWRSATPVVLRQMRNDELVLFDTDIEVASFKYYVPNARSMPHGMIGITATSPDGSVQGVRYHDGVRVDQRALQCNEDIARASGVWLCLCVPRETSQEYANIFGKEGLTMTDTAHFYRVDVMHFERMARADAN